MFVSSPDIQTLGCDVKRQLGCRLCAPLGRRWSCKKQK
uniref:Uncharacterized protein n=1 Tax=Anguilla anguilla TaxID=7936 RepID=A0A0E9ULB2_ANGAN